MKIQLVSLDILSDFLGALFSVLSVIGDWLYIVLLAPLAYAIGTAWDLTMDAVASSGLGLFAVPITVMIWTLSAILIVLGFRYIVRSITEW